MKCWNCLCERATTDDEKLWSATQDGWPCVVLPEGWHDRHGSHLCWGAYGGICDAPEWFSQVTPFEVVTLRADRDRLQAELDALRAVVESGAEYTALINEARREVERLARKGDA